jgi:hypothetical protein
MSVEIIKQESLIQTLEANLADIEQVNCPVKHNFSPGIYIREIFMPEGAHVIGHKHKTEHLNIMVRGRLLLQNIDGSYNEITAPAMYTAGKGRKIAVILEDTVWLNIFPTNETDIEKLEEMYLDKSEVWKYSAHKIEYSNLLPMSTQKYQLCGNRLYANGNIEEGEIIERMDKIEYIRKSESPNAMIKEEMLVAIKNIKGNLGGLKGYEITIKQEALS